jgi:hypothetical protein
MAIVCTYQGVLSVTMAATGYAIPSVQYGSSHSSIFSGLIGTRGTWGWNPQFYTGAVTPYTAYDFQTGLKSPATSDSWNPNLIEFTLYKLGLTGYSFWLFSGQAIAATDNKLLGTNPVIVGNKLISVLQNAPALTFTYGAFDVSVSGTTIAAPVLITTLAQSGIPVDARNILFAGPVITSGVGNLAAQINFNITGGLRMGATIDGTNTVQWNIYPSPSAIGTYPTTNYDLASKTNRYADVYNTTHLPFTAIFTVSDDLMVIAFSPTYDDVTFSNEPTTGLQAAFSGGTGLNAPIKPIFGGWILRGAVLADSQWYFVSFDWSKYWNLQFVGGPVNPSFGPVVDETGIYYTLDSAGAVFAQHTGPGPGLPSLVPLTPALPYPMHECYRGMLPTTRKC